MMGLLACGSQLPLPHQCVISRSWQDTIARYVQDTYMIGAEFVDPVYNAELDLYLTSYTIID